MKPLNCKCGGKIRQDKCHAEGFLVSCLKCDKCDEIFYSMDQARELLKLRELNKQIQGKRKIIKVGSSIAAILPKKVEKCGIKEGMVDEVSILSSNSIQIKFSKNIIQ